MNVEANVHIDTAAAFRVVQRRGKGKLDVRVAALWVQELAEDGDISLKKVNISDKAAGILTKNGSVQLNDKHSATMGLSYPVGRAQSGFVL